MRLPSADVPWTAYLPGAVVFGAGLQALHLFTVYFLEAKLTNASQLYGVLGVSATMLFYLFLIGRGVVWAAELNAVVWEVRRPQPPRISRAPEREAWGQRTRSRRPDSNRGPLHYEGKTSERRASTRGHSRARSCRK